MSNAFSENVESILAEKYFSQVEKVKRPFSVFGYVVTASTTVEVGTELTQKMYVDFPRFIWTTFISLE